MSERDFTKLKRVNIETELSEMKAEKGLLLVNIRGTNASGKSTVPLQMLLNDESAYVLTLDGKDVAMVYPKYQFATVGVYVGKKGISKTGGLDRVRTTADMKFILSKLNELPYNIVMEGILASTVFSTYADLLKKYAEDATERKGIVLNILPPFEVVKERLLTRNGGKEVKWEQVESKYNTVKKNHQKFLDAGLNSLSVDNSNITIEDTLDWFFKIIEKENV